MATTTTQKITIAATVAAGAIAVILTVINNTAAPLAEIPFNTAHGAPPAWTHNMDTTTPCVYDDRQIECMHQWGVYILNADQLNSFQMLSPVGKDAATFQPPNPIHCTGDANQSTTAIASGGGKIITTGTERPPGQCISCPGGCDPPIIGQIQVYKTTGGVLRYVGQIFAPTVTGVAPNYVSADGAFAWAAEGNIPVASWAKVNLTTLTVVATGQPRPAITPQPNIDGYTYTIQGTGVARYFKAVRMGGPPTPTPVTTTPTPVPNQFGQHITWATEKGIMAGCGGGNFCPGTPTNGLLTRAQYCATTFNAYRLDHPGEILPPCKPLYLDVICGAP